MDTVLSFYEKRIAGRKKLVKNSVKVGIYSRHLSDVFEITLLFNQIGIGIQKRGKISNSNSVE